MIRAANKELAGAVGLALVVIVEHAGRTMHLRDDHPLGAVDHEGAVVVISGMSPI